MHHRPNIINHRTVTVTILAVVVLTIPVMNVIRFWSAFRHWETLTNLEVSPSPLYIAFTGLFWSIAGIGLFWSLWTGHPKTRITTLILVPLYMIYYWTDRLVFQNYVRRENTPFALITTILVVFYTVFTLSFPANQNYISRKNEQ
jgi:hypothetical protein